MRCSAVFLYLVLLAALGAPDVVSAQNTAEGRPLTVDDYFRIRDLEDPQISPDGSRVAYTVTTSDLEEDESESALWVAPTGAAGEPVRFTAPGYSASHPRFSPDGTWLAFLADRDDGAPGAEGSGESQVWAFHRLGGDAQPLADVELSVESFEWSPDSSRLALVIRDPKPSTSEADQDEAEGDEDDRTEPWVIDRLQFKRDERGYLDRRRTHLYVFRLADRSLVQITSGDFDDDDPAWSPDGRLLAFTSNRSKEPDANDDTDLWIVSAENTDRGQTLRQLTSNPGADRSPAWSPDGETLAYVTVTEPELIWYSTPHLAVIPAAGGEARILTAELDRPVYSPRFTPDGHAILFYTEDAGEQPLMSIEPNGRHLRRRVADGVTVESFSLAREGALALLISEPDMPPEVFVQGQEREAPIRLTHTNDELLEEIRLGEVREVEVPSTDGVTIEAFLTLPPDHDPRLTYPTILWIHGGPVSQYDTRFDFEPHLLAAHGYVVLRPNPRGSSGYGEDFALAIWQSWGEKDYQDVMAAVDWAVARGYADPRRLGVGGWSYGGILTNYVITQTDRFAGAITGASEVLYVSNYGHDHYQLEWEKELGLPWENRALWERLSPFNRVQQIVTPTLIMGGEKDWNVPILNSEQLYQALKRLGRTTQLVVYPGEHHGIRRPSFQKDRFERYLDWFDTWVKGGSLDSRPDGLP